jgi:hypothetical protein
MGKNDTDAVAGQRRGIVDDGADADGTRGPQFTALVFPERRGGDQPLREFRRGRHAQVGPDEGRDKGRSQTAQAQRIPRARLIEQYDRNQSQESVGRFPERQYAGKPADKADFGEEQTMQA